MNAQTLRAFLIKALHKSAVWLAPFVAFIVVWQCLSWLNLWPKVLFPPPAEVAVAGWVDLRSGVLVKSLLVSLKSLGLGFLIGAGLAVPLAVLMGLHRASREFFDPLINLVQAIPGLAWIPFAIMWFGLGQTTITFIVALSVFFPVLHNGLTGIRMVQPVLVEAGRTLGAGQFDMVLHIIFPSTLPHLITGVRLGVAFGFRSLVGGEMIASSEGIGYAIYNAQQYFQSARILVGMLTIGIVWLIMDRVLLRPIEQRTVMRWGLVRDGVAPG